MAQPEILFSLLPVAGWLIGYYFINKRVYYCFIYLFIIIIIIIIIIINRQLLYTSLFTIIMVAQKEKIKNKIHLAWFMCFIKFNVLYRPNYRLQRCVGCCYIIVMQINSNERQSDSENEVWY